MAKKLMNLRYIGSVPSLIGKGKEFIYTVTSIQSKRYDDNRYDDNISLKKWNKLPSPRCWGWFGTLREAKKAVKINAGDMAECCYYNFVVIEKIFSGIPVMPDENVLWFHWEVDPKDPDKFKGKWVKCEEPKWAENIIGWSLG
jgi:hypothetical protein